jgi:hypothetical protein
MHSGSFGPTACGKTTLAQALAAEYRRQGRAVLVCDPLGIPWPQSTWQTVSAPELLAKAKASRNCVIFIEEASISISRDRDLSWLFTTSRHAGHKVHVIGQDGASLLPAMRQQLSEIFLFRCHPDLASIWARQFAQEEIANLAPTLNRYEFLHVRAYELPKKCRLAL